MRILVHGVAPDRQTGLRRTLERAGLRPDFSSAGSLMEALASLREDASRHVPVLLADGPFLIEAIRHVRARSVSAPLIVVRETTLSVWDYLDAGADEVLSVHMPGEEIRARVWAVMRRISQVPCTSVSRSGTLVVPMDGGVPTIAGKPLDLTQREHDLLLVIARSPGKLISREAIYDMLYSGKADTPFDKVIDVHMCNLRRKIDGAIGGRTQVIRTLRGRGYIFEGELAAQDA